jgi:hypothetical protein
MHFDQREQTALREAGLDTDDLETVSTAVAEAAAADAARAEDFFAGRETVYSDMDLAHSTGDVQEHDVDYCDLFTHAGDVRGYLRFRSWGVPVQDARVLDDDVVELRLGHTVNDRVRFAADPQAL